MEFVANFEMQSGETLDEHLFYKTIYFEVFGWYAEACPLTICVNPEGYLVAFKYFTDLGVSIPIWYIDEEISLMYFVNGKAKSLTPELPGAFLSGIVPYTWLAFDLFENKPKEEGTLFPFP